MFGCLFETDEDESEHENSAGAVVLKQPKLNYPPEPRGQTRICGLQNQGATCYLNSLLQTLFFTPEFRDGLFQLRAEDLSYEPNSKTNSKVRVIPIQLQKLFAKLLLLDQDSINTSELTDSFGWTGNEGFQQQDVQELNRILFSALESSLVGTPGEALIKNLYHGTSVTKVICQECSQVSEREEDYLDLPLILSGCSSLEESLSMSYVAMEILEGANQYKCESCNKHVNATKGSKIRSLPPILTFSLLRFDYDFQRGERFKDNKRYLFPVTLNMKEFCESSCLIEEDQDYELFSVVIHGGSCYGGHYHAYIRDVEGLGMWFEPKEQVTVVREDDNRQKDVIQCGHPVELITTLLKKLGGAASVNQLCQCMSKEAGISWNKRFKSQYGPLTKFFKKHSDVFRFSDFSGWVSLQSSSEASNNSRAIADQKQEQPSSDGNGFHETSSQSLSEGKTLPEPGHCWFDVNDSRISCIREKDLQHQFAGKESAYMLFYRRKNLVISMNDPILLVPDVLRNEVLEMNKDLTKQREDYDRRLNQISVKVLFASNYTVTDGILMLKQGVSTEPLVISLDRRNSVSDLLETVFKLDLFRDNKEDKTLHIARRLPSGLHLFEELTQHPEKSLLQSGVNSGTEVFLWNGNEVDGCKLYPGEDTAPVLLNITYSLSQDQEAVEIQKHFRKDTTVGEMKIMLCNSVGINYGDLLLSWVKSKGKNSEIVLLNLFQDGHTINEICLQDGDHLVAEKEVKTQQSSVQNVPILASQENEKHSNMISFVVENRCSTTESEEQNDSARSACWPAYSVKIHKEQTIGDLKSKVLVQADFQTIPEIVCRLRVDDDYQGLSPPLYEHETVDESWLREGQKLVLEAGAPLLQGEIMIRYYISSSTNTRKEMEQIINKTCTVRQCLQLLMENSELQGMTWHLRKTNWIGEPTDALDNEDATLESENIKNGDTLIVEEGRLPPKGFVRLSLRLTTAKQQSSEGVLTWITSGIQGLLGSSTMETSKKTDNSHESDSLEPIGDVEISQEDSLYDLKLQISLLPQLSDHVIPTPGFIRLQEVVNKQLTRVLRGTNRTLRQLKLTSSTQLSVCILHHEEELSPSAVLLKLKRRIPEERSYYAEQEVIFEPSEGASPASLRQFVAKVCDIPLNQLHLAKYFRAKYDWMVIEDRPKPQGKHKGGKKKINLRQSPFHLQDGDIIGVKHCQFDAENKDDFSTLADDEGKQKLQKEEEEKKLRRKEKRARRSEVPLTIHVDDFR
ncbi:ubiquitin carboxyl-terminal hydrolase 40-like isoform X2 [Oculina patagonica]